MLKMNFGESFDKFKEDYDNLKPFESFQLCYYNDMKGKHCFPWSVKQVAKWEVIENMIITLHDIFGVNTVWMERGE